MAAFVHNNGVRNVNLPTNGLLPDPHVPRASTGCWSCVRKLPIDLNFSLDGLQKTHDAIRGVPNNFVRTMATMREAANRYRDVRAAAPQCPDGGHARELRRDRARSASICRNMRSSTGSISRLSAATLPTPR